MGTLFYVAQGIFIVNTLVSAAGMQLKKLKHILLANVLNNVLTVMGMLLLGAYAAVVNGSLSAVMTLVLYFLRKKENTEKLEKGLLLFFGLTFIIGTGISYRTWGDLLTLSCSLLYVTALMQQTPSKYRRVIFINLICGIASDIYFMAYTNILTHGLQLASLIVAILRMDIPTRRKEEKVC